jgi:hypothetical protein
MISHGCTVAWVWPQQHSDATAQPWQIIVSP